MSNYTGYHCPVCGKAFAQGDDIVVCPDCGTPTTGRVTGAWAGAPTRISTAPVRNGPPPPAASDPGPSQATALCPRCGSHNPAGNIFCQVCGQQLTAGQAPADPFAGPFQAPGPEQPQGYRRAGQQPGPEQVPGRDYGPAGSPQWFQSIFSELEEGPELSPGISRRDVCDYVGPNGYLFLLRFQQLMEPGPGPKISINWSAFFFSFFYCFYRKMYKMGTILLAITVAAVLPAFWYAVPLFSEIMATEGALTVEALAALSSPAAQQFANASVIFRAVTLMVSLFCGFFFNKAYCRQVFREIRATREQGHFSSGSPEYHYALAHRGGVNINAVLVAICTLLVLYILAGVGLTYQLM